MQQVREREREEDPTHPSFMLRWLRQLITAIRSR